MPRTKRPASSVASSTTSSTVRLDQLSLEDRNTYNSILEDFDKQVEKLLLDIDKSHESANKTLESMTRVAILNMPKEARKKKVGECFKGFGKEAGDKIDKDNKEDDAMKEVAASINTQIKRQIKSTAKKPPRSAAATPSMAAPPSSAVRRSTRKRTVTARSSAMETPLAQTGRAAKNNGVFATPMITPKFDMTTPLNRTAMRLAKPNETLVSLSGSPVYSGLTTTAKKRGGKKAAASATLAAEIPLGHGRNLMLPVQAAAGGAAPVGSLDLDQEDIEKLASIRSQLDSMLVMAKASAE